MSPRENRNDRRRLGDERAFLLVRGAAPEGLVRDQRRASTKRSARASASFTRQLAEAAPSMTSTIRRRRLRRSSSSTSFPGTCSAAQPRAFATDSLALFIARHALEREFDAAVPEQWRHFFYMPFMHSETRRRPGTLRRAVLGPSRRQCEIRHRASRHHRALRPLPASQPGARTQDDRSRAGVPGRAQGFWPVDGRHAQPAVVSRSLDERLAPALVMTVDSGTHG